MSWESGWWCVRRLAVRREGVSGLGFRVLGFEYRVSSFTFRVKDSEFRVGGGGRKVEGVDRPATHAHDKRLLRAEERLPLRFTEILVTCRGRRVRSQ